MAIKPYKYKVRRLLPPALRPSGIQRGSGDHENFIGQIQGEKASDLEERFARGLNKLELGYQFRVRVTSQALGAQKLTRVFANMEGEAEIDFLVEARGQTIPVMIDGFVGHFMTPYQADHDRQKTIIVDSFGVNYGWRPTVRIPFTELVNQDYADRKVRDLFV